MAEKVYRINESTLTEIGDTLRSITGKSDKIDVIDIKTEIESIGSSSVEPEMATITIAKQTSEKTTIYVYYQDSSTDNGYKSSTSSTLADKTVTIPIGSLVIMLRNGSSSYTSPYINCSGAYKSIRSISYYTSLGATYKNQIRYIIVTGDLTIS